jgi:hypothetical protein
MPTIRPHAIAGLFYFAEPERLAHDVQQRTDRARLV